jgi:SprT protein
LSIKNQVIDKVHECFKKVNMEYDIPMVRFSKRGRVAGTANYGKWSVNFNPVLMRENPDIFLNQTVPHECAHLIARQRYSNRYIKPHGREWKYTMRQLGVNPKRCHSYDTSNSAVYHKNKYKYHCNCQDHIVGPTIHKKIQKGHRYTCKDCRSTLTFIKNCGKVSYKEAKRK